MISLNISRAAFPKVKRMWSFITTILCIAFSIFSLSWSSSWLQLPKFSKFSLFPITNNFVSVHVVDHSCSSSVHAVHHPRVIVLPVQFLLSILQLLLLVDCDMLKVGDISGASFHCSRTMSCAQCTQFNSSVRFK